MPPPVTTQTGRVVVWGDDSYKQIGDAPKTNDFVKIVPGGARQSLAIHEDRSLTLWEAKTPRQASRRCRRSHRCLATSPIPMPHVLALHEGGKVEGWGANNFGETDSPAGKFQAVAAGKGYSLGLDEDGFLRGEHAVALRPGPRIVV